MLASRAGGWAAERVGASVDPSGMDAHTAGFGERLRQFRVQAGLSQAELAERANLSPATVTALERGVRSLPYPRTVEALAAALGLSAAESAELAIRARRSARLRQTPPSRPALPPDRAPALPVWLTSFVARDREITSIRTLLDPTQSVIRLLTLTGPGGVGKTRLAVAGAATLGAAYPDGMVFVDLAPMQDPRLVTATIAEALGLREGGGRSARELVLEYLRDRRMLLVLDNFEHLLGAAPLLAAVLHHCPRVAMLVTSRAALRIQGEQRFVVEPLPAPAPTDDETPAGIGASPAAQLFVARAQAVVSAFVLDPTNAAAVAAVCRRLDGLPLAIELAAVRAGLLGPEALLRLLEHRLALLTRGAADLPERQRTLRGTLTWSYDLLEPAAQVLFRRLAVFAGGGTLEAIHAVCGHAGRPEVDLLDKLHGLVDSSLVRRIDADATEPRFGMLTTLRDYAEEQLTASGEADAIFARLRDWAVVLVERVEPEWLDPAQVARLDREQDNLRAALRWTLQQADVDAALRLGIGMWLLWYVRGRYTEGRAWLDEILHVASGSRHARLRGRALALGGHLATCEGDLVAAESLLREAQVAAEAASDIQGSGTVAHLLGNLARGRGDLPEAERLYTQALEVARQTRSQARQILSAALLAQVRFEQEDIAGARVLVTEVLRACAARDHPLPRAWVLSLSGRIAARAGDHAGAERQFEAFAQAMRAAGSQQGLVFGNLYSGHAALDRGDLAGAARRFREVLTVAQATHDEPMLARGLEGVARLVLPAEPRRGCALLAAAGALREQLGLPRARDDRVGLERWLPETHAAIGSAPGEVPSTAIALADALKACNC
jgi:predicted ATPase/transcriptional regulator with XRE-family HTH domain